MRKKRGNEATLNVVIMAVAVVVAASRVWSEYLRNCRPPGNWEHHYHLLGLQRMVPKREKFPSARTHYWHTVAHWVFINKRQFHFCWSTSWISGVLHSFSALFFFQRFPATVWFVGSDVWTRPFLDAPPLIFCHRFRAREGGPFTSAFERGLTFHIQEQGRKPISLLRGSIDEGVVGLEKPGPLGEHLSGFSVWASGSNLIAKTSIGILGLKDLVSKFASVLSISKEGFNTFHPVEQFSGFHEPANKYNLTQGKYYNASLFRY